MRRRLLAILGGLLGAAVILGPGTALGRSFSAPGIQDARAAARANLPADLLGRVIWTNGAARVEQADVLPGAFLLDREEALALVRGARVVCVGETHDHPSHHRVQAMCLQALREADPEAPLAVGLEMIPVIFQETLDRFSAGEIDEDGLREAVRWRETWGFDFELYRPIFAYARSHGVAVLGLNCDRTLVSRVSRVGLDRLEPRFLLELPELDLACEAHRRTFEENVGGAHGSMDRAAFERMYQAMVVWDEVMADHAARWFWRAGPTARLLILAGNGHIDGREGIARRFERRCGIAPLVVVPSEYGGDPIGEERLDPVQADLVWVTRERELPGTTDIAAFGVTAGDAPRDSGALIIDVAPDGQAKDLGIEPDDLVVSVDGRPIRAARDLADALSRPIARLSIVRAGRPAEVRLGPEGRLF